MPDSFRALARELGALHYENNALRAKLAEKDALLADYARVYGSNASERLYKPPGAVFAGVPRG